MAQVPSNLIPTRLTQLQDAPVASEDGLLWYVYGGNTYKIRAGDLLSVAGVPTSRQVIAGTGLQGGGQLSSNVTLSIAPAGVNSSLMSLTGVTPGTYGSDTAVPVITVDSAGRVTAMTTAPFSVSGFVPVTRQVIAGTGLSGGGALNANVTLNANFSDATPYSLFNSGYAGVAVTMSRSDHVHPAVDLAAAGQTTGLLGLSHGGTARSLTMQPGAVMWSGSDGLYVGPAGVAGQVLVSGGAAAPTWGSAIILSDQPANVVYAGPASGPAGATGFRALVNADLPVTLTGRSISGASNTLSNIANSSLTNSSVTLGTTNVALGSTALTLDGLTSVAVTGNPTSNLQLTTKQYVDNLIAAGINYHEPVRVESPASAGNLNASYYNGTDGVGASLTNAGTQAALVIDGVTMALGNRVLIYNQTAAAQNGVYTVTNVGSASTNWVLTRATDADTYGPGPLKLDEGSAFFVQSGATGAGETYVVNTVGVIIFGTTAITFAQISDIQIYTAGTGLTLTGTQFSLSDTAVTAASYGSASAVPVLTVNAQGQLTSVVNTNIEIAPSQVTGGTANGVAYFNGSAALTSGNAIVFDGVNLGVGTAAPAVFASQTSVTINGSSASRLELYSGDVSRFYIVATSGQTVMRNAGTSPFSYYIDTTELMRLTTTGLGIATTSPTSKLTVAGAGTFNALEDLSYTANDGTVYGGVPIGLLLNPTVALTSANSRVNYAAFSAPIMTATVAGGSTQNALYGNSSYPVISSSVATAKVLLRAYHGEAIRGNAADVSSSTSNQLIGGYFSAGHALTASASAYSSNVSGTESYGSVWVGSVGNVQAVRSQLFIGGFTGTSATITNAYAFNNSAITIGSASGTVTVTNLYGLYLAPPTVGASATITNRYGVYSGDTLGTNYFAGPVSLASTSSVTLSGGTANGVTYLNGSKVLTSGSALTFDGTNVLAINGTTNTIALRAASTSNTFELQSRPDISYSRLLSSSYLIDIATSANQPILFTVNNAEAMRLTSTGLGIGTSSPGAKLHVGAQGSVGASAATVIYQGDYTTNSQLRYIFNNGGSYYLGIGTDSSNNFIVGTATGSNGTSTSALMTVTQSGNLGLGVTPSAWVSSYRALQVGGSASIASTTDGFTTIVGQNWFVNSAGSDRYIVSNPATIYQQASGQHRWYTAPSGTAGNAITFTQAMTLDASGNLIVGGTSVGYTVRSQFVKDGTTASNSSVTDSAVLASRTDGAAGESVALRVKSGAGISGTTFAGQLISTGNNIFEIYTTGAIPLVFGTGSTERARIDSSGNLLVGTTSVTPTGNGISIQPLAGGSFSRVEIGHASGVSSGNPYMAFIYAGTTIGSITQSGTTAVLYNITSDQRLKENIVDAPEFGSVIDSIKVRSYDWKTDQTHQRAGFIAQELVTVTPEAVHQPSDPEEMMAVDYSKLVPMLVKEIQSLRKRLAAAGIA